MESKDKMDMPDFSSWPPHDIFSGNPTNQVIQIYLRMTIDAEWRATILKDPTYSDWLNENFNLGYLIDYWVVSGQVDEETVLKWANKIREKYDWSKNA